MKWYFYEALAIMLMMAVGATALKAAATPPAAVGFFGSVTGKVESRMEDGTSFQIKVTKAAPDENSKVKDAAPMIGLTLTLGTRMPRDKEGKPHPHADDVNYIKSLKPGDEIVVNVFAVRSDPSILRITKPGKSAAK